MSTHSLRPLLLLLACFSLISGLRAAIPAIAAGDSHSLFLKGDGSAWACGKGSEGQLGNGSSVNISSPVQVSGMTSGVAAISAGNAHSLFLKSDGTVWACGANNQGQLGDGTSTTRSTPVQITSLSGVEAIAAGYRFSLFLKTDGTVWACGDNGNGQYGNGSLSSLSTPVQVMTGVQAIAAGGGENGCYSLFLKTNGSVWAAGENSSGQLGDNSTGDRITAVQVSGMSSGVTAISAAEAYSLFLKSDGSVWACGSNASGQFGNGTFTSSSTPVQVQTGIQAIEAAYRHSLFVKTDGSARACGYNQSGQLGDNSNMTRQTPVQPTGMTSILAISGGGGISGSHSLFMKSDGSAWACGLGSNGQVGDGTFNSRSIPVLALQLVDTPVVIAPSATAITATTATLGGSVYSTGLSAATARGVVLAATATNANPAIGGSGVTNLSTTGGSGAFTVNATSLVPGTAYSFRAYATNSLGTGYSSTVTFTAPSNVATLSSLSLDVAALSPSFNSATLSYTATVPYFYSSVTVSPTRTQANATLTVNGTTVASGNNISIPLTTGSNTITIVVTAQDGTTTRTYTIAVTKQGLPPVISTQPLSRRVNPGSPVSFSVAVTGDGPFTYQWKKNSTNIPGATGSTYSIASAVAGDSGPYSCYVTGWGIAITKPAILVVGPYNSALEAAAISAGHPQNGLSHCLFLKTDGSAWASGGNFNGQLGDGTTTLRNIPVQVSGMTSGVKVITAGYARSFFQKADNSAWGCGLNDLGQFGDGTVTPRNPAGQVMTGVKAIASGKFHSLFLKTDGSVWASGGNTHGQLGDTTNTARNPPVQVSGMTSGVTAIAAGGSLNGGHSLFLKSDGTVWACGLNNRGQLGDSSTTNRSTPVQVLSEVQAIAAGGPQGQDAGHSLFLKYDGSVWACGDNSFGQLGDSASYGSYQFAPVQVSGMTGVQAIAAGSTFSVFLKYDGTVGACGDNGAGQLGDGTNTTRSTPMQVPGMANVQAISAGEYDTLFLKTDGFVWACGSNSSGQHGTAGNTNHKSPVQSLQLIVYQPGAWQQSNFGANASNESISGWDADPDRDGLPNLLERAFNLPPLTPSVPIVTPTGTSGLPRIWVTQGPGGPLLNIQYLRLKASTDPVGLTYFPQFSSALGEATWTAATGTESVASIDANWERVTITDTLSGTTRFARVKVVIQP
ncbi:cadherin-like beta sandwich domain-containing protein [Luteolibacter soli]|uniref:Cadherin-like beta sandwich domain-containing protein n=1 Tax=Luteolibacter soli TaxID=3135280 RepID=A0ABU9B0S1_9BACT